MWLISMSILSILFPLHNTETAALILARGGSKGIRLKNLQKVGGISLLSRAIFAAKSAEIHDITVSTDHPLIALQAIKDNITVFHRSPVTASDSAPSIWGVAEFLSHRFDISILILIQTTSPFTEPIHLRRALEKLTYPKPYDCIFAATRFPADEIVKGKWIRILRKQRSEPDWTATNSSRVCSNHFQPGDIYTTKNGLKRINKGAVPIVTEASVTLSRDISPNSLQNDRISDMESIFDTPRKAFLKRKVRRVLHEKQTISKENRNLKRKYKRLADKYSSLKSAITSLKKKMHLPEEQFNDVFFKAEAVDLLNRMLKKRSSSTRIKYSPILRKFALTLNFYSPTAYKYVRNIFKDALPHPRTLGKWYENTDATPGFTAEAFNILKSKYLASKKRLLCNLVVDEMAIRQQTLWNGKKTVGLVDHGVGSSEADRVASEAYVMLLVSLDQNWKLPVGYFFVKGLSSECRANLIKMCLSKCWEVGVDVVSLTFDGCPSNINAANLLGCQITAQNLKTTFRHLACDLEVAVFLDAAHMIKLVRNTFEAKKLLFDDQGREIKWQFLIDLLNLQKSETLNFANKLTPRHIDFRNQIMKVKLATQLLSMSVANALKLSEQLLTSTSSRFSGSEATVQFIENFNNLFDILNSRQRDRFGFKKPICKDNKDNIFDFLNKVKNYISGLQILIKYRRDLTMRILKKNLTESVCKTGFLGFIVCIESLKHLYKTLIEKDKLKYIATYRLSQDHLELLFGVIRRQGGYNNNPNTRQFQGIYRKLLGHLELRSSFSGNCVPLDNFTILGCSSATDVINDTAYRNKLTFTVRENDEDTSNFLLTDKPFKFHKVSKAKSYQLVRDIKKSKDLVSSADIIAKNNVEILGNLLDNQLDISISSQQIIGYIGGFVARSLIKVIKCEPCVSELITNKKLDFHKLIVIKDMGGLCYPSCDLFQICTKSETTIRMYIKEKKTQHFLKEEEVIRLKLNIIKYFLNTDVSSNLHEHSLDQPATFNHRIHLLRAIVDKYCDVRLHYFHKIDSAISSTSKRQQRNKLSLFEGI